MVLEGLLPPILSNPAVNICLVSLAFCAPTFRGKVGNNQGKDFLSSGS